MSTHTPRPWAYGSRTIVSTSDGRTVVPWTRSDMTIDDARLISAAPDFLAAARGDDEEMPRPIWPIGWLESMINECRARGPKATDDDPDAYWMMVDEVQNLHRNLRAAVAKAEGGAA